MLSNHKVLVLVEEVVSLVCHWSGIVLDGERCIAQLGLTEAARVAHTRRAVQLLSQVLQQQVTAAAEVAEAATEQQQRERM